MIINENQNKSVEIVNITLTSNNREYDLIQIFSRIEIVEDIESYTTIGNIKILDSAGLKELLPLIGGEKISIKFRTSREFDYYVKDFVIIKLVNEESTNNNIKLLNLYFVSEEFFNNFKQQYSISYNNKSISDIVSDIFINQLNSKKDINIENTSNLLNYIIPYKNPFDVIDVMSKKAINYSDNSAYLFFEDKEKFNFVSVNNLLSQDVDVDKRLLLDEIRRGDIHTNLYIGYVEYYEFMKSFDILDDIKSGVLGSTIFTFDYTNKSFMTSDINMNNYYNNTYTLGKSTKFNKEYNFNKSNVSEFTDYIMDKVVDSYTYPDNINQQSKNILRNRNRYNVFDSLSLILGKQGDSELTCGMLLDVKHSSISETNIVNSQDNGNYLVTSVKHIIEQGEGYTQILKLCKDSFFTDNELTSKITSKVNL